MSQGQSVLVVDEISDTEDVLRAVLEPRGWRVNRLRGELSPHETPAVVVIDAEAVPANRLRHAALESVPQVIIGTAQTPCDEPSSGERHYLHKPFHYAELIQTIERLAGRA